MPGYARPPQYFAQSVSFSPSGDISASNVQTAIQEVDTEKAPLQTGVRVYASSAARTSAIPSPSAGMVTYLTDTDTLESYDGSEWVAAGTGGATGGGTDEVFYENDQSVTTSYSITSGKNSISAGPVTINSGVVVTVPSGSVWSVV